MTSAEQIRDGLNCLIAHGDTVLVDAAHDVIYASLRPPVSPDWRSKVIKMAELGWLQFNDDPLRFKYIL